MTATLKDKTAIEVVQLIQTSPPNPTVRDVRHMKIGEHIHQGDVYLTKVADNWPRGRQRPDHQLAIGNTQGARHIMTGQGVRVYDGVQLPPNFDRKRLGPWTKRLSNKQIEDIFLGPVVVITDVPNDNPTLGHPEHAGYRLGCGVYATTYQANSAARARVQD